MIFGSGKLLKMRRIINMKKWSLLVVSLLIPVLAFAADEGHFPGKKHSIASSLYLLGNFMFEKPVYDLYLNYGYRLTQKDVLLFEGFT
jgi:hypothetical protein